MNFVNNSKQVSQKIKMIHTCLPGIIYQFKIDTEGKYSLPYVSPTVERYIGLSAEIVMNDLEKWIALVHPEDLGDLKASIVDSMQCMNEWRWVGRFIKKDYSVIGVRGISTPKKMRDGSIIWNGVFTEVSKKEMQLHLSEHRLNESQKIAHLGHWNWNIVDGDIYWSDEAFRIVGVEPGDIEPRYESFLAFIHPDDREGWKFAVTEAMTKNNYNFSHRLLLANGEMKYTHGQGNVIYDDKGKPVRMMGTLQDVTSQKKAQLKIERNRVRFEAMVESISDAIIYADTESNIILVNRSVNRIFGYLQSELIYNKINVLYAEDENNQPPGAKYGNSSVNAVDLPYIIKYRHKNGSEFQGETTITPLESESGELLGFLSVIRDVSERLLVDKILKSLAEGSKGLEFEFFLQDILTNLVKLYQSRYAFVSQLEPDKKSAKTLAFLVDGVIVKNIKYSLAGTPCQDVLSKVTDTVPKYASKIYPNDETLVKLGVESFFGAPLVLSNGSVIGIIAVMDTKAMTFDMWNKPVLGIFATRVALELERELANRQILHHQQRLEELVEQRSQKLIVARDEANQANLAKSEFLSHMSHELRTPLNAILGFGQLLATDPQQPLNDQQKNSVDEIMFAGKHLLELINEVLDLSRIESGLLNISIETIDIKPVLEACINQLQLLVTARGQNIQISLNDISTIRADKKSLKEVFINLISNAIKYGIKDGEIKIDTELNGKYLRINVRDNGPGISKDFLPRLFKPFERFESDQLSVEGTGIGLTICKKLIQAMSGNMGVENEANKGCNFWIELPHAQAQTLREIQAKKIVPAKLGQLSRHVHSILYIEDNPANLRLVTKILSTYTNHVISTANSAKKGISLAQQYLPDLILLDINLPDMDGYAVLDELQRSNKTKNIPVIAVSANAMADDIKRSESFGFKDYVTKPIDIDKFIKVINKYVKIDL